MRARTLIIIVSLLGSAGAIGQAVRLDRETRTSRAALAALGEKRAALEGQLRPAAQLAAAPVSLASRASIRASSPSSASPVPEARVISDRASLEALLVNDPALQNLYLAAERSNLDALYAPLFRRLGLSPVQIEACTELIMKRHEQRMDLADIQQSHELDGDDPALATLHRKAAADFQVRQVALLGSAGYREFNDYERTLPVWRLVNRFAGAVALEGQPLAAAQAEELTRVVASASPPYTEGRAADPNQVDWPAALDGAAKVLSPPQQLSFLNMIPRYAVEDGAASAPPK